MYFVHKGRSLQIRGEDSCFWWPSKLDRMETDVDNRRGRSLSQGRSWRSLKHSTDAQTDILLSQIHISSTRSLVYLRRGLPQLKNAHLGRRRSFDWWNWQGLQPTVSCGWGGGGAPSERQNNTACYGAGPLFRQLRRTTEARQANKFLKGPTLICWRSRK